MTPSQLIADIGDRAALDLLVADGTEAEAWERMMQDVDERPLSGKERR